MDIPPRNTNDPVQFPVPFDRDADEREKAWLTQYGFGALSA